MRGDTVDLDELGTRAKSLIPHRRITEDGNIGTEHWFLSLIRDAELLCSREAAWKARTRRTS